MSDASIESALEPVKLLQRICERGRDDGGRLAVQTLCLAQPGATGRVPQGPSEVPGGLGVVVGTLSTGNVAPRDRQPSEPSVVHDHVRLRHHQIDPVACIAARIGARNVEHAGTTEGGEAVGSAASGGQLSTAGRSAEMISDGRSDGDREMLVKRVGEHLLPAAESGRLRRPGPCGSGSMRRRPSCRPARPPHSRSGPGDAAPGSVVWRLDERECRRDAW
jgi:hypothetical protein